MKRILVLLMVVCLGLFVAACSKKDGDTTGGDTNGGTTDNVDNGDTDTNGDENGDEAEEEEEEELENLDMGEGEEEGLPTLPDADLDDIDLSVGGEEKES